MQLLLRILCTRRELILLSCSIKPNNQYEVHTKHSRVSINYISFCSLFSFAFDLSSFLILLLFRDIKVSFASPLLLFPRHIPSVVFLSFSRASLFLVFTFSFNFSFPHRLSSIKSSLSQLLLYIRTVLILPLLLCPFSRAPSITLSIISLPLLFISSHLCGHVYTKIRSPVTDTHPDY